MQLKLFCASSLFTVLACGGGSPTQPAQSTQPSAPPSASFTVSPQGQAIVGVTAVTFQAVPDPAAGATYSWTFGDGAGLSALNATHVYNQEGAFSAVLTATNRVGSATSSAVVTVRNVTGLWWPDFLYGPCFAVRLTQSGSRVDAVAFNGSLAAAAVRSPRDIGLTIAASTTPGQSCGAIENKSGTFDASLSTFTLALSPAQSETWRRQ